MDLRDYLALQQRFVDAELDRLVPPESTAPETIHRAMRYSLFAGGKRIRPILCLEAARAVSDCPAGVRKAHPALEELERPFQRKIATLQLSDDLFQLVEAGLERLDGLPARVVFGHQHILARG